MNLSNKLSLGTLILTCSTLVACGGGGGGGGGSDTYSIGGTLSGLGSGKSIVLQNNGGDDLSLTASGSFTFGAELDNAASYAVTVLTQPDAQKCTVTGGSGTVSGADVSNVAVDCVDAPPTDRFVISGNNDGTLSIFRNNAMTGYATAMAYFDAGDGFSIQDLVYDESNGRIVLITSGKIYVLSFDADTGEIELVDSRDTTGSSSHLALNAAGTAAYVASGTSSSQAVNMFPIGAGGILSPVDSTVLSVDPDYITLDPSGSYLYVVSRTDARVLIYTVNADDSLSNTATTIDTDTTPTSLGFNPAGTKAYLTRQNNSNNLVVYDVGSNGSLSNPTSFSNSNSPIDQAVNANGSQLYVLDSSNSNINRYSIDGAGDLTFVDSTNISFTATDITLGHTGERLYVSHSQDDLVSTIDISSTDGSLSVAGWVRAYSSANTVASIGANGELLPTPSFLLAPDQSGLNIFATASDGMLTQEATINVASAMIDGQVAIDVNQGLMLGAGEDSIFDDLLTSYRFDPVTAATTQGDVHVVTVDAQTEINRIELGGSGRFMYVLDKARDFSSTAFVRAYAYDGSSTPIINATAIDTESLGINRGPDNMSLHPAGQYLYSVNSFGDTITTLRINESDGSLTSAGQFTPGQSGPGIGRPFDLQFHPNGRYAYVGLEDDSEIVRVVVETNGSLSNPDRVTPPQNNGNDVSPGPIAVHPNGRFLYNGERDFDAISVYAISESDFSLTHQNRVNTADETPGWLEIDPQGRFLYVRSRNETIEVFSINATTGNLTSIQSPVTAGTGAGFIPSMTLVAPLQ